MTLSPAGALWLLHHELRLSWRGMGGKRAWLLLTAGGVLWAVVHFVAWKLLSSKPLSGVEQIPRAAMAIAGGMFWLFASIMVSQTVAHAVAALFDRGDLDLLLSSPLPPRAIFMIRGLGIAVGSCLVPALLLLPFAHVGVVAGRPGMIAIYFVIVSLALASAAAGMALTMSLVRAFGARRAKTIAQIFGALIGAGFFLLSQVQTMLPRGQREALAAWASHETQVGGWFSPDSVLWWPVKAMLGEAVPLLLVVAAGVGSFWLVVNLTYRRFVSGTQESLSGGKTRALNAPGPVRFRSGAVRLLLAKEWKLLARDPQIITQTLLQVLYLIPLLFIGFRGGRGTMLLVPGFVVITAMLAGNLAWLTIAAEDAPELVGTSPMAIARVRLIKAAAAILPVLALLVPLGLWWLVRDPVAALVLLFCCLGGMVSAAICHIWNPRKGNRRDMKQRYRESKLTNILEMLGSFGWAGVAFCMNGHWLWLPLPLFFVLLGPGSAWMLGRTARQEGL
ncbi:MAG: hypothetical protein LH481_11075 [Burkholderiales bacterium]|nr:hypothetical protein [Burkholderiales bacterium]